jgi:hypothetical protein
VLAVIDREVRPPAEIGLKGIGEGPRKIVGQGIRGFEVDARRP